MIDKSPYYDLTKRLKSRNGIVDMHIHSDSSFGDEHGKIGATPMQIFGDLANFANETNQTISFSITDHNNFKDVQQIVEEIERNKEEYKNINFITGCEFSVTGDSFGQFRKGDGTFSNLTPSFHMLAYNFNPYDERLLYYSSLIDDTGLKFKRQNIVFSYGAYVLAAKKFLEEFGIKTDILAFKDFKFDPNLDESQNVENLMWHTLSLDLDFSKLLEKYSKKYLVVNAFKEYTQKTSNLINAKYLDVFEVMEYVEQAGGVCVLAHPSLFQKNLVKPEYIDTNDEFNKRYEKFEHRQDFMDYCMYELCNPNKLKKNGEKLKGIVGIELYHPDCQSSKNNFDQLCSYVDQYGLYVTAGSDTHYNLTKTIVPGSVISNNIESYAKAKYNLPKSLDCNFAITSLKLIDDLKTGKIIQRNSTNKIEDVCVECNAKGNIKTNHKAISQFINEIEIWDSQNKQKNSNTIEEKHIKEYLNKLSCLCEEYENILLNMETNEKKVEAFFACNKFRSSICQMQKYVSNIEDNEEFKKLKKVNEELREKLFEDEDFALLVQQRINDQMSKAYNEEHRKKLEEFFNY